MYTIPPIIQTIKSSYPALSHTQKVGLYDSTMPLLKKALESGIHEDIIKYATASIYCLEDMILARTLSEVFNGMMPDAIKAMKENEKWQDAALRLLKKKYPDLDANSSVQGQTAFEGEVPCIGDFGDYCSFTGQADRLNDLKDIVDYYNDLSFYKNSVDAMFEVLNAGIEIRRFLEKNAGFLQSALRDEFKIENIIINKLCQQMEKYKIVKREKSGDSFKLSVMAYLK
jgi:hypothetical protein